MGSRDRKESSCTPRGPKNSRSVLASAFGRSFVRDLVRSDFTELNRKVDGETAEWMIISSFLRQILRVTVGSRIPAFGCCRWKTTSPSFPCGRMNRFVIHPHIRSFLDSLWIHSTPGQPVVWSSIQAFIHPSVPSPVRLGVQPAVIHAFIHLSTRRFFCSAIQELLNSCMQFSQSFDLSCMGPPVDRCCGLVSG